MAVVSCVGIGFSSWAVGNTSASFDVEVTAGELVTEPIYVDVFVGAVKTEGFSYTAYGIYSGTNELTPTNVGTLSYQVNVNVASAANYDFLDGSNVFSFCATLISNCDILSNSEYFLSDQTTVSNTGTTGYVDTGATSISTGTSGNYTSGGSTLYYYPFVVKTTIGSDYLSSTSLPFLLSFKFTGNFYSIVSSVGSLQFSLYLSDVDSGGVPS